MPETVLAEVRAVLERHALVMKHVQRPRRKLETLFMEIVEQARAEGMQTSGARSGGAMAEFLTTEERSTVDDAGVDERLLDRLVHERQPATPAAQER
jgi:hypothetical protein